MLDKLEIKIKKIKEKLGEKRLTVIFFCIFGITMLFALQMAKVYGRSKQTNSDSSNRTLYNMITNMKNTEIFIEKARITTTKEEQISTFTEVLCNVNLAKETFSELPVDQDSMNNISKFLTQTADFSKYCIKKLTTSKLEEQDYTILDEINKSCIIVTNTLDEIYTEIEKGRINWDEVEKRAQEELEKEDNILISGISDLKNNFQEYEGLIYDGAYSSHLESNKPKLLEGLKDVSISEAKNKARSCILSKFKDTEIYSLEYVGEINGKLDVYSFNALLKGSNNPIDIQITKKGGLLYLMVQDRAVKENKLNEDEAKSVGQKYLKNIGIDNMQATYTVEQDGMMTINYALVQGNVIIYTDLIKVKVALDNGEVCSVECGGYIFNHHERNELTPTITIDEAKSVLNKNVGVESIHLAIIPNEINEEVLTYEFKGKIEKREYIIYINASTCVEEQVLIILNTKGGKLTM